MKKSLITGISGRLIPLQMNSLLLSILLLSICNVTLLKSQTTYVNDLSPEFELVEDFEFTLVDKFIPGEDFTFTIPLKDETQRNELTFQDWSGNPCQPVTPGYPGVNGSFKIPGSCAITAGTEQISINVTVSGGGPDSDPVTFFINVSRKPVKIALILDISGSMGGAAYNPTNPTSSTRWEVLKASVNGFNQFFESIFQVNGDLGSLTYFTTDTIEPRPSVISGNISIFNSSHSQPAEKFSSKVNLDMGPPRHPLNLTAMGKGLMAGKAKLNPGSDQLKKSALLFTDGLQNVYPRVIYGGNALEDPTLFLNDPAATDQIKYYPIGILAGEVAPLILTQIADASGGMMALSNDINADWSDKFDNIFLAITNTGGSPELVFRERAEKNATLLQKTFNLNRGVSRMAVRVEFPQNSGLSVKLLKDSINYTSFASRVSGSTYEHFTFRFPVVNKQVILRPEGNWIIEISGDSRCETRISVMVDDHYLDYKCSTDKILYTVGDTIKMKTSLSFNGKRLTDPLNRVSVLLLKPGEDIGDLLARTEVIVVADSSDPGTPAQQKLVSFLNDTALCSKLKATKQLIDLQYSDSGNYSGSFSSTEFTGIYNLTFFMEGVIPGSGKFQRLEARDLLFKFGEADPDATAVSVSIDSSSATSSSSKGTNNVSITIRPVNKFGKFLGPGFDSRIKVAVKSGKQDGKDIWTELKPAGKVSDSSDPGKDPVLRTIADNLNGEYRIVLQNIRKNSDPVLRITVMDDVIREGRLSGICKPKQRSEIWNYLISGILLIITLIISVIKLGKTGKFLKILIITLFVIWLIILFLQRAGIINPIGNGCY